MFHGLLINTPDHGIRFLEADAIASIHEHGVDLWIDSAAAQNLPAPEHKAPVYDEDPATQTKWSHVIHKYTGRKTGITSAEAAPAALRPGPAAAGGTIEQ